MNKTYAQTIREQAPDFLRQYVNWFMDRQMKKPTFKQHLLKHASWKNW